MRGTLVVFEGAEGAGKTTQVARVGQWLTGLGVRHLLVREPGGTVLGERVREIVLDPTRTLTPRAELLLFLASRAELVGSTMQPALVAGTLVVADRFMLSTYAYQIAGRGLPEHEVIAANRAATGGLSPDLTVLIRHPVREGLERAGRRGATDRFEREGESFHRTVAEAFDRFADPKWQRLHPECGPIVAIDGEGTEDEVFARVSTALLKARLTDVLSPEAFAARPEPG